MQMGMSATEICTFGKVTGCLIILMKPDKEKETKKTNSAGTTSVRIPKELLAELNRLALLLPMPPSGNQIAVAFLEAMVEAANGNHLEVERILNAFEASGSKYPPPPSSTPKPRGVDAVAIEGAALGTLEVTAQSPPTGGPSDKTSPKVKGAGKGQGAQR